MMVATSLCRSDRSRGPLVVAEGVGSSCLSLPFLDLGGREGPASGRTTLGGGACWDGPTAGAFAVLVSEAAMIARAAQRLVVRLVAVATPGGDDHQGVPLPGLVRRGSLGLKARWKRPIVRRDPRKNLCTIRVDARTAPGADRLACCEPRRTLHCRRFSPGLPA